MTIWIVTDELASLERTITPEQWMDRVCSAFKEAAMVRKYKSFNLEQLQEYMKKDFDIDLVSTRIKLDKPYFSRVR